MTAHRSRCHRKRARNLPVASFVVLQPKHLSNFSHGYGSRHSAVIPRSFKAWLARPCCSTSSSPDRYAPPAPVFKYAGIRVQVRRNRCSSVRNDRSSPVRNRCSGARSRCSSASGIRTFRQGFRRPPALRFHLKTVCVQNVQRARPRKTHSLLGAQGPGSFNKRIHDGRRRSRRSLSVVDVKTLLR